jgi:Ca2+-dependent lipid-binding protein
MGVLTVKVIKATNLADKDFVGQTDPYVEIELEQDNMVCVFFLRSDCLFC